MKPKRIILVRHGQSQGNADQSIYTTIPDHRVELTQKGQKQALAAGIKIKKIIGTEKVHAYVSPLTRTRQTYAGIEKGIRSNIADMLEDPRIREQEYGHLNSYTKSVEEVMAERRAYGKFYYRLPDGESPADVYDRMSTFMESLYRAFEQPDYSPNTLLVSHGAAIRVFLMRWYRLKVEDFLNLKNPTNCQLVVMEQNEKGKYALIQGLNKRGEERVNE
ncbi:MAG: phosphoglycerate mutase family protein [Anaerolineae bacterium]